MMSMARKVLVVDDDALFRNLAARVLRAWGHTVVGEAGSVADGIASAIALRPDTVLADIGLPDGNGFELTRRLRELGWQPRVVLISSDSDDANAGAALRVGASGFVPKDELSGRRLKSLIEYGTA
jgi:DNA-binding NarL/FixJ family response regulator